jgi:hypothetical protein
MIKEKNILVNNDYKFYRSIHSLPFWNYERIVSTNDHRYLLVTDYYDILPEIKVDETIWMEISLQSFELGNKLKSKIYIAELSNIIKLRKEYNQIVDSNFILCHQAYDDRDKEIISIAQNHINLFAPGFKFNDSNDLEYYNSIIEADRMAKQLAMKIELKTLEFESKYNKNKEKSIDLYKVFSALQRHFKLQLNPRTYTTYQFLTDSQTMALELKKNVRR